MTRLALIAALALALLAAPAAAAPPWEAPRQATVGCHCTDEPWQLAFGSSGRAIGIVTSSLRQNPIVATRAPDGTWRQLLGPPVSDAHLGVHDDRALLLGIRSSGSAPGRAVLVSGDTSGEFGTPRDLGPATRTGLAVAPSGAAVAAWTRPNGELMIIRRAPRRSRGWRFSRPARIGIDNNRGHPVVAAVNNRGDALVMHRASNRRTYVRPIDRKGRLLERIEVGRSPGSDTYAVALADNGRWVAGWNSQHFSKAGSTGLYVDIYTGSLRSRKAVRAFGEFYNDIGIAPRAIQARIDSTGRPIVAWSSYEVITPSQYSAARRLVRYVTGTASGALGQPQTIRVEDRDALLADLETGPGGRAVLLWSTGNMKFGGPENENVTPQLHALHRPAAGQPFGPDELIDEPAAPAAVAFDPVSERPLAIWDSLRESFRG